MSKPKKAKHNYHDKVMEVALTSDLGAGLHIVNVCHDDWCGIFKGGCCNCNPEVGTPKKHVRE